MDITTLPVRPTRLDELRQLVDVEIGPTEWHEITQERIDAFAEITGDRQWIHTDPAKAADSPLGGTIAHGLYSLSLGPVFSYSLLSFDSFAHSLNYGYDKVRFTAPVPVGSYVRMRATLRAADNVTGGIQLRVEQKFECTATEKPVIIAESLGRVVESDQTATG